MTTLSLGTLQVRVKDPRRITHDEQVSYERMANRAVLPALIAESTRHKLGTLAERQFKVPSVIFRVDLAKPEPDSLNILDVDLDLSAVGLAEKLGIPVAVRLADLLLSSGIKEVAHYVSAKRHRERTEQSFLVEGLARCGVKVIEPHGFAEIPDCPTFLHAAHDDLNTHVSEEVRNRVVRQCLTWPFFEGGMKNYLSRTSPGAVCLTDVSGVRELDARFPQGYVVKPLAGRNCARIIVCKPGGRLTASRGKVAELIAHGDGGKFIVQRLLERERIMHNKQEWFEETSLFFTVYRAQAILLGGLALSRRSSDIVCLSRNAMVQPLTLH